MIIENERIKNLHLLAFGDEEGAEIAVLVAKFLQIKETISINSMRDNKLVGNVLFTPFVFEKFSEKKCYLLAPLAVLPEYQNSGVGSELVENGIKKLKELNVDAIFVLGIPTFYPKFGFIPTDKETPYPDLLFTPQAWLMLELNKGSMTEVHGKTFAITEFMDKVFWDTSAYVDK